MDVNLGRGATQPTKHTLSPRKAPLMHPQSQSALGWATMALTHPRLPLVIRDISWAVPTSFTAAARRPALRRHSVNVPLHGDERLLMDSKADVFKTQLLSCFPKVQDKLRLPNANQERTRVHEMNPRSGIRNYLRTNLLAQRHPQGPVLSVDSISLWGDITRGCTLKQKPMLRVPEEGVWFLKCQLSRNLIGILGSCSNATSFPSCGEFGFCFSKDIHKSLFFFISLV